MTTNAFVKRTFIVLGVAVLALAAWAVVDVLLIAFGGALFAVFLRGVAAQLVRILPIPMRVSVIVVFLILIVLVLLALWHSGSQIAARFDQLWQNIETASGQIARTVSAYEWGDLVLSEARDIGERIGGGTLVSRLTGVASMAASALTVAILILFIGIYLALGPQTYRNGVILIFPRHLRDRIAHTLDTMGRALWLWLLGQFCAMAVIGILTTIGLWLMGIPLALSLGVLAGVLEFVPIVGPILAAIPALLIAFAEEPLLAAYVALFYIALQQVESNLLLPLLAERVVSLPPALTLVATAIFGILFGPLGILLATPLMLVVLVAVKILYVEEVLREPTDVPGEPDRETPAPPTDGGRRTATGAGR